jgi:ABC-type glycerol-3-phosphate transport system substrate-binding protein
LKWIAADAWENLSAEPYNAEVAAADHFDYVKELTRDSDGNLRALTYQATPGGIFYRRSMAEEALGVSEPEDVSALMTDMDAFLEMGRKLKEKGYFLVPSVNDIQRLFFFNKTQPWVVDGKLVIEDVVLDYLDVAKTIRDEGLDAKADTWSGEWFTGMNGNIFSYCLPTWGLFFVIEPGATAPAEPVKGVEYSFGDWGLAHGPASYMWGGTWLGISKTSEKKDLAWEFVKTVTTNKNFLKAWADTSGDFTGDAVLDEELAATTSREFLGGQNHYAYFLDEAKKLSDSGWAGRITQYDEDIQNAFLVALGEYVNETMTKDEAIQSFKDAVASLYPEITVE